MLLADEYISDFFDKKQLCNYQGLCTNSVHHFLAMFVSSFCSNALKAKLIAIDLVPDFYWLNIIC